MLSRPSVVFVMLLAIAVSACEDGAVAPSLGDTAETAVAGGVNAVVLEPQAAASPFGAAVLPLPVLSTFTSDAVDAPPATGGPDQPTELVGLSSTSSVLVRNASSGIATKPVEIVVSEDNHTASAVYDFTAVDTGILRVETTMAVDHLVYAATLQTVDEGSSGRVVTRLWCNKSGDLHTQQFRDVGTYEPHRPFGVRMDIDMSTKTWSVAIDDEMNGFSDDPVTAGLPFVNDPAIISQVGSVHAGVLYARASSDTEPARIAYDDISISLVDRGMPVAVDIRPGVCPNPLSVRSRGMLQAAVLGSEALDVGQIDVSTVLLEGVAPAMGPPGPRPIIADTATPFEGGDCGCNDLDGDGWADLNLRFDAEELMEAINPQPGDDHRTLTLTGNLVDGTPISGSDCIVVRGLPPMAPAAARR